MNERNLEALTGLLTWAMLDGADPQQVAFRLAERGVLVPAALTDREASGMAWFAYGATESSTEIPSYEAIRAELERIAKGEHERPIT